MNAKQSGRTHQPPAPYSWLWLLVSGVVVWADMVTKQWATEGLEKT
jgi:hypothetical protein